MTDLEELEAAAKLAEDSVLLVAHRERRIELLLAALRAEAEGLKADRAMAAEASHLYVKAADRMAAIIRSRKRAA